MNTMRLRSAMLLAESTEKKSLQATPGGHNKHNGHMA